MLLNPNAMDIDSPVSKKRDFDWDQHQVFFGMFDFA